MTAIVCISSADLPGIESLLRQGDEAYARQDYDGALSFYEQAESLTQDPGRVSFNKAAAYYRLERFKEAIECYRRCLEDEQAPPERRALAFFYRGNATLQQAGDDAGQLADAVAAYRAALHLADLKTPWRKDAAHNLELAQMLWLKAREKQPPEKLKPKQQVPKTDGKENEPKKKDSSLVPVDPAKDAKREKSNDLPKGSKSQTLQSGAIPQVLLDKEQVVPLSPDATLATLANEAERIAAARRQQRNPTGPAQLSTKDW